MKRPECWTVCGVLVYDKPTNYVSLSLRNVANQFTHFYVHAHSNLLFYSDCEIKKAASRQTKQIMKVDDHAFGLLQENILTCQMKKVHKRTQKVLYELVKECVVRSDTSGHRVISPEARPRFSLQFSLANVFLDVTQQWFPSCSRPTSLREHYQMMLSAIC